MTIELHALKRIRLRRETTFATDMTSTGTSFTSFLDVPAMVGTVNMTLQEQMNPVDVTQQYVDGKQESLIGIKPWQMSFTMPLHATGVAASAGVASVTSAMGAILLQAMGAELLAASGGTAVAVSPSPSSTGCTVTSSQGSRCAAGTHIANYPGATTWELREVATRSTDAITMKMAFSTTMAGTILRASMYYLTEPATDPSTLQFAVDGVELDDRFILLGGRCTLGFGFAWGQIPTLQVSVSGNYWFRYTSGSAISAASFSNFSPIVLQGSELHVATNGSTTANLQSPCSAFSLNLNTNWIPLRTPGGVQTEFGVRRGRSAPVVSGSWTIPYQNDSEWDSLEAYDDRAVFFQIGGALIDGSKGSGAILISCPTVQIVNVQRVDSGGIASQQISFEGRHDTGLTATDELTRSPLRIGVF